MDMRDKLVSAATAYDQRCEAQERRRRYPVNIYRLGHILGRIDEVMADIEAGASPRAALLAAFNDRLLDALLKAVGEPKFTRDEMLGQGYTYRRASA